MQTEAIISTLLDAAAFLKNSAQEVAAQSIKDAYEAAKDYLRRKFGAGSASAKAMELATEKPESATRKALLVEEGVAAELANDPELVRQIERLAVMLPGSSRPAWQNVRVTGRNNHVQVAGRDIVHAERHIQRNAITPDDRHLAVEQRKKVRVLIAALAARLAREDGKPNFAAVHRMLQRRYSLASYLLIPRERYDDAVKFLRQQCAIHRSRLRRRNPAAYQNDFFRAIHARRETLGWDKSQLYQFAFAKLGLKAPIASLKELGPNQLNALAAFIQRQTTSMSA